MAGTHRQPCSLKIDRPRADRSREPHPLADKLWADGYDKYIKDISRYWWGCDDPHAYLHAGYISERVYPRAHKYRKPAAAPWYRAKTASFVAHRTDGIKKAYGVEVGVTTEPSLWLRRALSPLAVNARQRDMLQLMLAGCDPQDVAAAQKRNHQSVYHDLKDMRTRATTGMREALRDSTSCTVEDWRNHESV